MAAVLRVLWNRDFDRRAAQLFAAYRARGEQELYRELVEECAPRLVPLVRSRLRRCGRRLDAHELVLDTFSQIYRCRQSYRDCGPGSFVRWFLAVAENLMRQEVRAATRRAQREQGAAQPVADRAADPFELLLKSEEQRLAWLTWAQLRRLALEAVQELPAGQWEALVRFATDGLTYEALALKLAVPRGALIMRIQRARKRVLEHVRARVADGTLSQRVRDCVRAMG
jgi:RNA polymerase sigma factor (sigma-70 family)